MSQPLPQTLPSHWYWDDSQYRRELESIWAKSWLCVGRESDWTAVGEFRRLVIGGEQLIVVRREDGELGAFFNTCRHRGSQLCDRDSGVFDRGRVRCPYHAWTYDLDGRLLAAPGSGQLSGFPKQDLALYPAQVRSWRGFVFLNMAVDPRALPEDEFDLPADTFAAWPLESLALAHREQHEVQCNWKVFWENYNECYHCSGVHPELCQLVPVYGQGVMELEDLPQGHALRDADSPLREGAVTWSLDGQATLPRFDGLGERELSAGMSYLALLPGLFLVAHVDYLRSVRLLPLSPERLLLTVDWLVAPDALPLSSEAVERLVALGRQVVGEDAAICEVNQRGLRCSRHESGLLMPVEKDVGEFHRWLKERLGDPG
jgi:Rieske 2Fe-2S family protein